jgi:hypothetical protein
MFGRKFMVRAMTRDRFDSSAARQPVPGHAVELQAQRRNDAALPGSDDDPVQRRNRRTGSQDASADGAQPATSISDRYALRRM